MTLPRISTFSLKLIVSVAIVVSILIIPLQTFELKPQSPNPKIAVRFSWPDVSAYIIEQDVTSKLEGVLSSLTDIKSIGSRSQRGAGSLILEFKPGSSLDICRFRVASAVRQVYSELPDNMTYPQVEVLHSSDQTVPILSYSIASIDDPVRIYDYVVSHITPQLRSLRGIDDVRIYGAAAPIIEVQFNPERLRNLEISTEDLASNIRNYFKTEFIGKGTEENERRRIEQTESKLVIRCFDNEDINWGSIPLKKIGERIIFLDDVATVVVSHPVPTSYSRTNGSNTVNILVYSKANTNLIQVSHEIRAMMDILKLDMPASFSLKLTNDTTQYLREQLAKLITQSAISLAVAFAIIGLVVGSLAYIFRLFALLSTTILISSVIYLVFSVHFHLYTISGIFISTFVITTDFLLLTFGRSRHRGNQFTTNMSCCLIAVFCFGAILLLDPIAQQNLKDFALVIVINSFVSFVVYTLLFKEGQIPVKTVRGRTQAFRIIRTRHAVVGVLSYIRRYRVLITLGLILSFGIPTTLIFEWITKFNLIQLNPKVVRVVEKSTGGAMRLFSEYVLISSFHTEPERTALHVKATMEEGSTVHQMNELLLNIETYIKQFQEIDSYNTLVTGPDNGSIDILFNESVSPEFPFYLKSKLEEQSIRLGGSDWSIYGVGTGFSNAIKQGFKSDYILLNGYSYEQLYDLALLLKQTLEKSSRVKGLEIAP
ncbi:MAG: efflux RND transporter permease subunit, partial [Chryseolinea sp.]